MTDRQALLAAIDADLATTLSALADLAEDNGDAHLARAWRWLLRRRKMPEFRQGLWRWAKSNKGGNWEAMGESSWRLPQELYQSLFRKQYVRREGDSWATMTGQDGPKNRNEFNTCSEALEAVALILAKASSVGFDIDKPDWW